MAKQSRLMTAAEMRLIKAAIAAVEIREAWDNCMTSNEAFDKSIKDERIAVAAVLRERGKK